MMQSIIQTLNGRPRRITRGPCFACSVLFVRRIYASRFASVVLHK